MDVMPWQDDPGTYADTDAYRTARDAVLDALRDEPRLYAPEELYPLVEEVAGQDGLPRDAWDVLYGIAVHEDAVELVEGGAVQGRELYYALDPDHV